MLDMLRDKYYGYRFSEKEENIYNQFSLLNVFAKNKLGDYWVATGMFTSLVQLLEQRYFDIQDLEGNIQITFTTSQMPHK